MQRRQLGSSGFEVSTIGFGTWAIGGHMWGGQDDAPERRWPFTLRLTTASTGSIPPRSMGPAIPRKSSDERSSNCRLRSDL